MRTDEADIPLMLNEAVENRLTQREAKIFILRFGLDGQDSRTLQVVGSHIGVSRERIRQIIQKCLRKLRGRSKAKTPSVLVELQNVISSTLKDENYSFEENFYYIHSTAFSHVPTMQAVPLIFALGFRSKREEDEFREAIGTLLGQIKEDDLDYANEKKATKRLNKLIRQIDASNAGRLPKYTTECRDVSSAPFSRSGSYFSKLLHREVQYESLLEKRFLLLFEQSNNVEYFQEQPVKISYEKDGKILHYYPDAYVLFDSGVHALVEIKPVFHMGLIDNILKWEALQKHCERNQLGCLYTDGYKTMTELKEMEVPLGYKQELLGLIDRKSIIDFDDYREVKNYYPVTRNHLVSFIVNNGIRFELNPFLLTYR